MWIRYYGLPGEVHSDQGANFASAEFWQIILCMSISLHGCKRVWASYLVLVPLRDFLIYLQDIIIILLPKPFLLKLPSLTAGPSTRWR